MNKLTLIFAAIFCGITVFAVGFDYHNSHGFSFVPKVEQRKKERDSDVHKFGIRQNIRNSSLRISGGRGFMHGK